MNCYPVALKDKKCKIRVTLELAEQEASCVHDVKGGHTPAQSGGQGQGR
jgi:hypothetical protein